MTKKKKPFKIKRKRKTIVLREDSLLNQKIIDHLEDLFLLASPRTLLKSISYVFFQYLYYAEADGYPSHFKRISEDFYFLHHFFAECSEAFQDQVAIDYLEYVNS